MLALLIITVLALFLLVALVCVYGLRHELQVEREKRRALEQVDLVELKESASRLCDLALSMVSHKSALSMGEIQTWQLRAHEATTNASIDGLVQAAKNTRMLITGSSARATTVIPDDVFRPLHEDPPTIGTWPRG